MVLDRMGNILDIAKLIDVISVFAKHVGRSTLSMSFLDHTIAVLKVFISNLISPSGCNAQLVYYRTINHLERPRRSTSLILKGLRENLGT